MQPAVILLIIVVAVLIIFIARTSLQKTASYSDLQQQLQELQRQQNSTARDEKLTIVGDQLGSFMDSNLLLIDKSILNKAIPKTGASLYFVGAADAISQRYGLTEEDFYQIAYQAVFLFLESEAEALAIMRSLPEMRKDPLKFEAMTEGGRDILKCLSGDYEQAAFKLATLVDEWEELSLVTG